MTEISQISSSQLKQLLKRIEHIKTRGSPKLVRIFGGVGTARPTKNPHFNTTTKPGLELHLAQSMRIMQVTKHKNFVLYYRCLHAHLIRAYSNTPILFDGMLTKLKEMHDRNPS